MDFIKKTLASVMEFHSTFGHDIDTLPTAELRKLRIALISEERQELEMAIKEQDHAAIIDAIADLAYVIGGTLIAFDGDKQSVPYVEVGQILAIMMIEEMGETLSGDLEILVKNIKILETMIADESAPIVGTVCIMACTVLARMSLLCETCDIDFVGAVEEAHRSNMTKLWSDDAVLRAEQIDSDPVRFSDIAFKVRPDLGDGLIGYRVDDGKILKCPSYSDADFTPFVSQHFIDLLEA